MNTLCYTLATAGHIDHGKSALVRALTGIEPDRLPEEKARGLTIELGFAHFSLPASFPLPWYSGRGQGWGASPSDALDPHPNPPPEYQGRGNAPADFSLAIGIIDVPGHEDFVKNMVAGVGSIDAALLVVAADDRWMPQTEEHLQILMHLGVGRGVVALTKSDLVEQPDAAAATVRERLRGTFLESAPIVPTSTVTGLGIAELKSALAHTLAAAPPQRDLGKPRLAVDRAFSLRGVGTIVTGTLTGGIFKTGQAVVVQPGSIACRIRTVHTHGRQVDVGQPGARVALNLPDVEVAGARASRAAGAVARGDAITLPTLGGPTRIVDAVLQPLARAHYPPPRNGTPVWLHHGTAATPARLRLLQPTGSGHVLARLKLAAPIFALAGDRFVLRDWSELYTLTGGALLDVDPKPLRRAGRQIPFLEMRAASPSDVSAFVVSQLIRDRAVGRSTLLMRSRWGADEVDRAAEQLVRRGIAVQTGAILFHAGAWAELREAAASAVDGHHRAHPERPGLPLVELHRGLDQRGLSAGAADAVIASLCEKDFVRRGPVIARADHRPALPARLAVAGDRLRATLREHPFDPPSRNQLQRDDASVQALKFLIASGQAIEIGPDIVLAAEAYTRAAELVRAHLRQHGPATVSQLKSLLASSRRVMVPLVEKLDRDGVTRRQGDLRVLRE